MADDKTELMNNYNFNRVMIKEYNKGNPTVTDGRASELYRDMNDIKKVLKSDHNTNVPLLSPIRPHNYGKK